MKLFADPMRMGIVAEFETPELLRDALVRLREAGYVRMDTYTPYPVEGVAGELNLGRPGTTRVALIAGLGGGVFAYVFQWWMTAVNYPLDVGGRPLHSAPAFIPITFESTVLFASVAAFIALWIGSRLPEPWSPLTEVDGFERASIDRFWLGIDVRDEHYDPQRSEAELLAAGALQVVHPEVVE
jgi:Alternative complex III, ActD subunit